MTHANAALTPKTRLELARLVIDDGWPIARAVRYKDRNVVERTFNKLRDNRAFAMRTYKPGYIFTGTVAVAALRIWLRDLTR